MLCELGALQGHDAIRRSARQLGLQLPDAEFQFPTKLVEGEHAFLVWTAPSERFEVEDGADSFGSRGGRIVAQTIFHWFSKGFWTMSHEATNRHEQAGIAADWFSTTRLRRATSPA